MTSFDTSEFMSLNVMTFAGRLWNFHASKGQRLMHCSSLVPSHQYESSLSIFYFSAISDDRRCALAPDLMAGL
jgi:hypothetical protein